MSDVKFSRKQSLQTHYRDQAVNLLAYHHFKEGEDASLAQCEIDYHLRNDEAYDYPDSSDDEGFEALNCALENLEEHGKVEKLLQTNGAEQYRFTQNHN